MQDKSNFMHVNVAKIHYQDTGKGFPIVLVHAGIANLEMWDDQVATLAKNYRVIAHDMRGFGKSQPVPGDFAHYQDLITILEKLDIEKCILVGCSKGGGVVMDVALASPDMVAGLIVVAGIAHGLTLESEPEPPPQWEEAVEAFKAGDLEKTNELEVQIWVDGYNQPVGRADQRVREKVRAMNANVLKNETTFQGASEKVLEPKAGTRLDQISVPTLFIYGNLDEPVISLATEKMVREMPNATGKVIKDTAHLPNMEKPAEFNEIMLDFMENLSLS